MATREGIKGRGLTEAVSLGAGRNRLWVDRRGGIFVHVRVGDLTTQQNWGDREGPRQQDM